MKQNLMVFSIPEQFILRPYAKKCTVIFMKQNLMVFFNTIRFYFYLVKSDGIEK